MTKPDTSRERGCFECGEEVYCYSCGAHLGYSALLDRAEKAEAELRILKEAGICEVASRNPSVMEYMKHWEARAEKAEADRDTAYARGRELGIMEAAEIAFEADDCYLARISILALLNANAPQEDA